jgi:hypothetical protein
LSEEKKKPLAKPDTDSQRNIRETASAEPLRAPDTQSMREFQASYREKKEEKKKSG